VVPACVYSMQLAIEHMCDRRQRVPVFGMDMRKCPGDVGEVDAAGDSRVLIDVVRIVVINEVIAKRLCKHHPCNYCKTHADSDECPARRQLTSSYLVHDCDCQNSNGKIITNRDGAPSLACSFVLCNLSFLRPPFVNQNITTQFRHGCWYLLEIVIGSIW